MTGWGGVTLRTSELRKMGLTVGAAELALLGSGGGIRPGFLPPQEASSQLKSSSPQSQLLSSGERPWELWR